MLVLHHMRSINMDSDCLAFTSGALNAFDVLQTRTIFSLAYIHKHEIQFQPETQLHRMKNHEQTITHTRYWFHFSIDLRIQTFKFEFTSFWLWEFIVEHINWIPTFGQLSLCVCCRNFWSKVKSNEKLSRSVHDSICLSRLVITWSHTNDFQRLISSWFSSTLNLHVHLKMIQFILEKKKK